MTFHPMDVHLGSRLKRRRIELGLSQKVLGDYLGVSYQQVQKYESGHNSMKARLLTELSYILGVPVFYFYLSHHCCDNILGVNCRVSDKRGGQSL